MGRKLGGGGVGTKAETDCGTDGREWIGMTCVHELRDDRNVLRRRHDSYIGKRKLTLGRTHDSRVTGLRFETSNRAMQLWCRACRLWR